MTAPTEVFSLGLSEDEPMLSSQTACPHPATWDYSPANCVYSLAQCNTTYVVQNCYVWKC